MSRWRNNSYNDDDEMFVTKRLMMYGSISKVPQRKKKRMEARRDYKVLEFEPFKQKTEEMRE